MKNIAHLVTCLRNTAQKLASSTDYEWGHMGACNCGFLAREITRLTKAEIHQRALQQPGDWSEQLRDYCPSSGLPMDDLIDALTAYGFGIDALRHLERLSDPEVLDFIGVSHLQHNVKSDVVSYLHGWADLLQSTSLKEELLNATTPDFKAVL